MINNYRRVTDGCETCRFVKKEEGMITKSHTLRCLNSPSQESIVQKGCICNDYQNQGELLEEQNKIYQRAKKEWNRIE